LLKIFGRRIEQRSARRAAGAVAHQVEAAELFTNGRGQSLDVYLPGDGGGVVLSVAAGAAQCGRSGFVLLRAAGDQHDSGASFDQCAANGQSESG
jgi:hypothetical protein